MGLTMSERRAITREVAKRYQKAQKKEKWKMLNEFVETIGYTRCYASYLLRNWGREPKTNCGWVVVCGTLYQIPLCVGRGDGIK